jgi:ABC-2 type transport system ATP-binding protein
MIVADSLTRSYGARIAIQNVSFRVAGGEVVGFLGPNGAGKSTTMKILTGYLEPEGGDASIDGFSVIDHPIEAKRRVGYLPETTPLYEDMTPREFVGLMARLRSPRPPGAAAIDQVMELCGLTQVRDRRIARLSKGYRQRVGLAQAMVHDPPALILDEPTSGIDPVQMSEVRQLIRSLARDRAILLSSHDLGQVSEICDRVIIINKGLIVAQDRIENLTHLLAGGGSIRLRTDGPPAAVTATLARLPSIRAASFDGEHHLVTFDADVRPQREIVKAIVDADWTLLAMEEVKADLEAVFLQYAGTPARSDA